jgi:hypothetical protein
MMAKELSRSDLVPENLPDAKSIMAEGHALAKESPLTRTLHMKKHGVSSEREYKERMRDKKQTLFHAHYGLSTWDATAEVSWPNNTSERRTVIRSD